MDFFVVFMDCRRYVVVKRKWISNPVLGEEAVMFFSANGSAMANFGMVPEFYFNQERDSCYNVFVIKSFGKIEKIVLYY